MKKTLILLFLLPLCLYSASNTGSSAGSFLKINVGTRSSAMGGAYAGLADDNEALLFNPAGIALVTVPELSGGHIIWFSDISLEHAQFVLPLDKTFTLGFSGIYMNNGTFDAYTSAAVSAGSFTAYDLSAGVSLGARVSDSLIAGLTVKYIEDKIENASSTSFAADLGVIFPKFAPGVSLGVALQNIGTPVKLGSMEEQLPVSFRAGFAVAASPDNVITFDGYTHPGEGDINISAGTEFYLQDRVFCLRAGFIFPLNTKTSDFISGLSAGVGINLDSLSFNYTLVPNSELGYLHRVGIGFAFGSKEKKQKSKVVQEKPKRLDSASPETVSPVVVRQGAVPKAPEKSIPVIVPSSTPGIEDINESGLSKKSETKFSGAVSTPGLNLPAITVPAIIAPAKPEKTEVIPVTSKSYESKTTKEFPHLASGKMRIAVMEFKEKNISKEKAETVCDFIRTELSNNSGLIIVERNNMENILKEQMFQKSGCTDADCAVELGKILNVEKIIVGSVSILDQKIYVNIRLVDIETAQAIFGETKEIASESALYSSCRDLARSINEKITSAK